MVDTQALRACEDNTSWRFESSLRHWKRSVAQLVERCVWDAEAPGSSPGTPTHYAGMVQW